MARAAVPLCRAFLIAGNLDAMQHLSGFAVAHFKAEQLVDVDEAERLAAIDGEGANRIAEGPNLVHDGVSFRVRHRKDWRAQAGKINAGAIRSVNCVVRAGIRRDLGDHFSGLGIDDVPMRAFERGDVKYFSIRRDG